MPREPLGKLQSERDTCQVGLPRSSPSWSPSFTYWMMPPSFKGLPDTGPGTEEGELHSFAQNFKISPSDSQSSGLLDASRHSQSPSLPVWEDSVQTVGVSVFGGSLPPFLGPGVGHRGSYVSHSDAGAEGDPPSGLHRMQLGQDAARVRCQRGQHLAVAATKAGGVRVNKVPPPMQTPGRGRSGKSTASRE